MSARKAGRGQEVVVVTGGAIGIGAAIAEEFGRRGAHVVTMDPVVALDGTPEKSTEQTTAQRIVDAGGSARASNTSVTDDAAVRALFAELVDEFGALDAVVNVAGISRPTGFASGTEEDWIRVLDVHLNGYLTVLRNALPLMAAAGHGRILGVTSGSGWRAADAGAYSCAKRAVASLTWQLGQAPPKGVTVNALSPIAATRMVLNALSRAGSNNPSGSTGASGGVALGAAPPPEDLGPVGAYLAGDEFSWCSGQIIFSNGAEASVVAPPHLLEAARTSDVKSLAHALGTVVPVAFAPAEAAQVSMGGSVPRLGAAFDEAPGAEGGAAAMRRCVVVTDDAAWGTAIDEALSARGVESVGAGPGGAGGYADAAAQLERVLGEAGTVDAVVVALVGPGATSGSGAAGDRWQQILDEHTGVTDHILGDAGWVRGVADYSARTERPVRVVTLTNATTAGGRSRGMAAAQLSRAAHMATSDRVDAFAVSVETDADSGRRATAELVGHLVSAPDAAALSGAELVASAEWIGLRRHPLPSGTVSYGGPTIPDWFDGALRGIVTGRTDAKEG